MGLLDYPAALLAGVDAWMSPWLPVAARLTLWAALGAVISMELYRLLSPQAKIAQAKEALVRTQRLVARFDGEFQEAWPHLRRMIGLAFRRVALVFPATIAASLPALAVIVWLSNQYGAEYPQSGEPVQVTVDGEFDGSWVRQEREAPRARVTDGGGAPVAEVPVTKPVPVIHKRQWWNAIIGNPAGYLDDSLPFDRIDISLPHQQVVSFGPDWMRGWEVVFFAVMIIVAFGYKQVRRIS